MPLYETRKIWGLTPSVGPDYDTVTLENKDAVTIMAGQQVSVHPGGVGMILANAGDNLKNAIGTAAEDISQGNSGAVRIDGVLSLPDWTESSGSLTLLARTVYYLDLISGKMSASPPVVSGQVVQIVGRSIGPNELHVKVEESILI